MHQLGWYRRAFGPLRDWRLVFILQRALCFGFSSKYVEVFMEQKIQLDKISYIMLTISGIVALLCMLALMFLAFLGFGVGLGDSNGGGWIFFLIMVGGIALVPSIISWVAQLILYFQGIRRYRKENLRSARAFGIGNCIAAILGNVYVLLVLSMGEDWSFGWIITNLAPGIGIVYMIFPLTLLILSKKRDNSVQNPVYYEEENNPENGY